MARQWIRSGMTSTVRVTYLDGAEPLEVRSSAGDAVAYERAFKVKFQDAVGATSMLWIAWRAARRQDLTHEAQFDQWITRVDDFEILDEDSEDDEDPTKPDRSDD